MNSWRVKYRKRLIRENITCIDTCFFFSPNVGHNESREKKEESFHVKPVLRFILEGKAFLDVYEGKARWRWFTQIFVSTLTTRADAGQKSLLQGKTLRAVFVFSRTRPLISFLFLLFYLRGSCECDLERTLMLLEAASGGKKKVIFLSLQTRVDNLKTVPFDVKRNLCSS